MLKNPDILNHLVETEQAYTFLKNVRGPLANWQCELYYVLAMLRAPDKPTWFLTLSAADVHCPEIICSCFKTVWPKIKEMRSNENELK